MNEHDATPSITPQTQALSLYIQNAVERLQNSSSSDSTEAQQAQSRLLFLGNWQDPYPRLLVTDPILEPVDKLTWQIIRLNISNPGAVTTFPSYDVIRSYANIKSNHTVSRALAILRATRWLSLCARVRDKGGRYVGNIYVLHDEPVTLGDAMFLDGEYIAFLHKGREHKHTRVRKVVESVLATIEEMINGGGDITGERLQTRSYERRMGVINRGQQQDNVSSTTIKQSDFYAVSPPQLKELEEEEPHTQESHTTESETSHVQIMHTAKTDEKDHVHLLHMESETQKLHTDEYSSCSSNKNTTTTKHTPHTSAKDSEALHFPPKISANERDLAQMYLSTIDDSRQQAVLDEWHGRLQSASRRSNPIDNPIGYLASLCRRVKTGEFHITIGVKVRDAREREQRRAEEEKRRVKREEQKHAETLAEIKNRPTANLTGIARRMDKIRKEHKEKLRGAVDE